LSGLYEKDVKMKKIHYLLFFLFLFGISKVAFAEFYRYTDEKGVTRYTDDLSQVPPAQRKKAEAYTSEVSKPEPQKDVTAGGTVATPESDADKIEVSEGQDMAQLEKLNKKKATLDKEYTDLVKEKDALVKSKEGIKKEDELKAYNEKIVDLNERISAFEKKRKDFAKEVDAFNERFKQ
jgi:hypothetical protein